MAASSSINLSSSNDDVTETGWMAVPRNCFKTVTSGGGTYLSPKYFAAHFERVFGSVTAYLWGKERGETLSLLYKFLQSKGGDILVDIGIFV